MAVRTSPRFKDALKLVVADRVCAGTSVAAESGARVEILENNTSQDFSANLATLLRHERIDFVYLFYTRLLCGSLLSDFRHRIINFHPSLLPACPGLHGFEDSLASGALVIGTTVHFVDDGIDTGPQILQTFITRSPAESITDLRHRIFLQQCASLLQVHHWLEQRRIRVSDGHVCVEQARYAIGPFVPELEHPDAAALVEPAMRGAFGSSQMP